jgi:hypothetical protein
MDQLVLQVQLVQLAILVQLVLKVQQAILGLLDLRAILVLQVLKETQV